MCVLDELMFVLHVLLTRNTSVTLTHICRIAPTHSITVMAGLLECPAPLGEDKQIF